MMLNTNLEDGSLQPLSNRRAATVMIGGSSLANHDAQKGGCAKPPRLRQICPAPMREGARFSTRGTS
jgi:hypothetical protein